MQTIHGSNNVLFPAMWWNPRGDLEGNAGGDSGATCVTYELSQLFHKTLKGYSEYCSTRKADRIGMVYQSGSKPDDVGEMCFALDGVVQSARLPIDGNLVSSVRFAATGGGLDRLSLLRFGAGNLFARGS